MSKVTVASLSEAVGLRELMRNGALGVEEIQPGSFNRRQPAPGSSGNDGARSKP